MTRTERPHLGDLPTKAASGGHLYVIRFDNGTVKVGSTTDPSTRVRMHQTAGAQFGIAVVDVWVSPAFDSYRSAEARLIRAAVAMSSGVVMREWFWGVSFPRLVQIADALCSPDPDEAVVCLPGAPVDVWTRIKGALGVDTQAEAAGRCGIPLRTLQRMLADPGRSLIRNVTKVSSATGIRIDDLFPVTPAFAEVA